MVTFKPADILHVPAQTLLLQERLLAVPAVEVSDPDVDFLVTLEAAGVAERLGAFGALEGSQVQVRACMALEAVLVHEALVTRGALVHTRLGAVGLLVARETAAVSEPWREGGEFTKFFIIKFVSVKI